MKYIHKDYSNRHIHLGLISCCNKGDQVGLLYGFRNGISKVKENKIFYFEKDRNLEILKNTLVSYLSYDYDSFSPKVEYIHPISSLVIHSDQRSSYRADKIYHDDKTWQLINEGIPYFDYSYRRDYCIHFPIINNDECIIWRGLFGCGIYMDKEANVYEMYRELTNLRKHNIWPTLEELTNIIVNFKSQIDSLNAYDIIDSYKITKECTYIRRVGKDNQYFEDLCRYLPCNDKFLSYLLPSNGENLFYDDNAYPSDGYKDGSFFLEEETIEAREKAKTEYSKEKHLAFMINDYFVNVNEKKERVESLGKQLENEFDIKNASAVTSKFRGEITDNLITLINEYNESTVAG